MYFVDYLYILLSGIGCKDLAILRLKIRQRIPQLNKGIALIGCEIK